MSKKLNVEPMQKAKTQILTKINKCKLQAMDLTFCEASEGDTSMDGIGNDISGEAGIEDLLTQESAKNGIFWDVTMCGSCKNRRFGGT
jgi:hypothetical protein